ncbi:MAG: CYTH domain-containing protein [bacterium]|nr:CYTH domain-containing protein [bacterium]
MATEIERKYLVKNDRWKQFVSKEFIIKQGYLNTDPSRTVRVRLKGEDAYITIKGPSENNISRAEFEYNIPWDDALGLLKMCHRPVIEKIRYEVNYNEITFEVDVFEGDNAGLILAEVELVDEAQVVELPGWIGEEVSDDERYYNSYLSKIPYKSW